MSCKLIIHRIFDGPRALNEAEARKTKAKLLELAEELGGRDDPELVRLDGWGEKGIANDF